MTQRYQDIIDPTGTFADERDVTLSPRLGTLRGRTAALVDNGKPNGEVLLRELGERLTQHHGLAGYRVCTKGYFGTPVEDELVAEIAAGSDLAVAAVGD